MWFALRFVFSALVDLFVLGYFVFFVGLHGLFALIGFGWYYDVGCVVLFV